MTNELGTTLNDIEAMAERKREALVALNYMSRNVIGYNPHNHYETIRKYIEEN